MATSGFGCYDRGGTHSLARSALKTLQPDVSSARTPRRENNSCFGSSGRKRCRCEGSQRRKVRRATCFLFKQQRNESFLDASNLLAAASFVLTKKSARSSEGADIKDERSRVVKATGSLIRLSSGMSRRATSQRIFFFLPLAK